MKNNEMTRTAIRVILARVTMMNTIYKFEPTMNIENWKRLESELNGMLVILKNIADDGRFYNIHYTDDEIEFGYYEDNGEWVKIEK